MSIKKIAPYVIFVVFAVSFYSYFSNKEASYKNITTFTECIDAGFPILETYPEQCKTPDRRTFINESQKMSTTTEVVVATSKLIEKPNLITLESIKENDLIESGVTISGKARGYWFFEGSFPIELRDSTGKVLATTPAQATTEWMTEEFVPFTATLTFTQPITATGTLTLRKDNPSGEPQFDDSIQGTVKFNRQMKNIKLYYYNESLDKDKDGKLLCGTKGLIPVVRSIPVTQTPLQDALTLLLNSQATEQEAFSGLRNLYPLQGVKLQKINLDKGVLALTIDDPFNKTRGTECERNILRLQLEKTAKEFTEVKTITVLPQVIFQP